MSGRLSLRRALLGFVCLIAVAALGWLLARDGGRPRLTPAEFRGDAISSVAGLRLPGSWNGRTLSRSLAGHLEASLPSGWTPSCHRMGEPAGPGRFFCGVTEEPDSGMLWASFLVDPRLGRIRLFRTGALPVIRAT